MIWSIFGKDCCAIGLATSKTAKIADPWGGVSKKGRACFELPNAGEALLLKQDSSALKQKDLIAARHFSRS